MFILGCTQSHTTSVWHTTLLGKLLLKNLRCAVLYMSQTYFYLLYTECPDCGGMCLIKCINCVLCDNQINCAIYFDGFINIGYKCFILLLGYNWHRKNHEDPSATPATVQTKNGQSGEVKQYSVSDMYIAWLFKACWCVCVCVCV